MKGWQFNNTNEPLELVEKADPKATPGTVIIDVKASGLCHSDVATLRDPGWLNILAKVPIVLGHEISGIISEVGEGVTGDKVGVCPVGKDGLGPGNGRDGGYANKVLVPACDLVKIPEGVTFAQAAAGTDAGMTSYHAMFNKGGAKTGMKVGVIGIGGLGQMAAGELAKEIGCAGVYENVSDLAQVAPELIVDYAGFGTTTAEAIDAVAVGGKVVLVGMGKLETTINTTNLILKSVQLQGSVGGTVEDVAAVYELMGQGHLDPVLTEITFDEIPEGLARLERHEVTGRLVANLE